MLRQSKLTVLLFRKQQCIQISKKTNIRELDFARGGGGICIWKEWECLSFLFGVLISDFGLI